MSSSVTETVWQRGRFDARGGARKLLFGRMYEDAAIELDAFRPGGRVVCVASAGCTAMRLAPSHDVVAVDVNPVQLAYARHRCAGAPSARGAAARFMALARTFAPLAGWRRSRVRAFLDLEDPAEQTAYWRRFRRSSARETPEPTSVVTRTAFDSSLDRTWSSLLYYEQISRRPPLLLHLLLPSPIRTEGKRSEVGDEVKCSYRSGYLVKKVTCIEDRRRYGFEVIRHLLGAMRRDASAAERPGCTTAPDATAPGDHER